MSAVDHDPPADWQAFRAARERFLRRVRPEAAAEPPRAVCPDAIPAQWNAGGEESRPERSARRP